MDTVSAAIEFYRRGLAQEAESLCERRLKIDHNDLETLSLLAEILIATGRNARAVEILTRILVRRPDDAASHRRLGAALAALGRNADAVNALRDAIRIEPGYPRAHNNLGKALLALEDVPAAIVSFEAALRLDRDYAIAHTNLGLAYRADRDPARALECYDRALAAAPTLVDAWLGRGAALAALNRFDDALASVDRALEQRPADALTLTQRAAVLLSMERTPECLDAADAALAVDAGSAAAHNVRAGALRRLGRRAEAVRALESALACDPHHADAWGNLGTILHEMGRFADAVVACRHAIDEDPTNIQARTRWLARMIPSVPESTAEVATSRKLFDAALAEFDTWLAKRTLTVDDALLLAQQQFFYLAYEEESNLPQLRKFRSAAAARLADVSVVPPFLNRVPASRSARRVKLGVVSAHVYDHSVFNAILSGWLVGLDPRHVEITLLHVGSRQDGCTRAAAARCAHVELGPRNVANWARTIHARDLDVLIYPEIGMHDTTLALASLRLAERQWAAWGHPETSGLPTIDGFLSADLFEPPDAAHHYSETLLRLPNLGVSIAPYAVEPAAIDLDQLGLVREGPRFLCPGVPFKYRPQHDAVLIEIARRVGRCTFVFFEHEIPQLSQQLMERLRTAFFQAGLDSAEYLRSVAWQSRPAFFALLRQSDVYLDTLGFSGFNTLMQAIECHLPCVTLEGRFLRGRLGSGILKRLGMTDCIAHDTREYVDIAVKLAVDTDYRTAIRQAIRDAESVLYRDPAALDALSAQLLA